LWLRPSKLFLSKIFQKNLKPYLYRQIIFQRSFNIFVLHINSSELPFAPSTTHKNLSSLITEESGKFHLFFSKWFFFQLSFRWTREEKSFLWRKLLHKKKTLFLIACELLNFLYTEEFLLKKKIMNIKGKGRKFTSFWRNSFVFELNQIICYRRDNLNRFWIDWKHG
jgi:hypothetical protein